MMKMTVCIEKGGVTEYTITVSAIVGNAKMKGVTTKVIMSMSMIMNTMIMMTTSSGISASLSPTKPHTSPFGLNA